MLLLLRMNELLLFIILSPKQLPRIAYLIVILVVFMLLNALVRLPTACLSLCLALVLRFPLHHVLVLWISHLSHVRQLRLLHLVRGRVVYDLLRRHHEPLLLRGWLLCVLILLLLY